MIKPFLVGFIFIFLFAFCVIINFNCSDKDEQINPHISKEKCKHCHLQNESNLNKDQKLSEINKKCIDCHHKLLYEEKLQKLPYGFEVVMSHRKHILSTTEVQKDIKFYKNQIKTTICIDCHKDFNHPEYLSDENKALYGKKSLIVAKPLMERCLGCHLKNKLHTTCNDCHPSIQDNTLVSDSTTCIKCHDKYLTQSTTFKETQTSKVVINHQVHKDKRVLLCKDCHIQKPHGKTQVANGFCFTCHSPKLNNSGSECEKCHEGYKSRKVDYNKGGTFQILYSHEKHSFNCSDCHIEDKKQHGLTNKNKIKLEQCLKCHESASIKDVNKCENCHGQKINEKVIIKNISRSSINFNHFPHKDIYNCFDCHNMNTKHGSLNNNIDLKKCISCHDNISEKSKVKCINCHEFKVEDSVILPHENFKKLTYQHKSHTEKKLENCSDCHINKSSHGELNLSQLNKRHCISCHKETQRIENVRCFKCHQDNVNKVVELKQLSTSKVLFNHSSHIYGKSDLCLYCHNYNPEAHGKQLKNSNVNKSCIDCHFRVDIGTDLLCSKCHIKFENKVANVKLNTYQTYFKHSDHNLKNNAFCSTCHIATYKYKHGLMFPNISPNNYCKNCHHKSNSTLACLTCHKDVSSIQPKEIYSKGKNLIFNHNNHLSAVKNSGNKNDCTVCHKYVNGTISKGAGNSVNCIGCHHRENMEKNLSCSACHDNKYFASIGLQQLKRKGNISILFNHSSHLKTGDYQCLNCHNWLNGRISTSTFKTQKCLTCHNDITKYKCTACHGSITSSEFKTDVSNPKVLQSYIDLHKKITNGKND